MKKSRRLKTIVELAAFNEKKAAKTMVDSRIQKEDEEKKLAQLTTFQEQYSKRLHNNASQGLAASQLIEYREFLYKIGKAIKEQEQVVGGMNESLGGHMAVWRSARHRRQGMDKIMDTTRSYEIRLQDKREQAEIDDRPRK